MKQGFYRIACASPKVAVADIEANTRQILELASEAFKTDADIVVFPEMCVTAYTCADLFHNRELLDASAKSLLTIAQYSSSIPGTVLVVGAPVQWRGALYNCAVFIADGQITAYIPKTYLPSYNEFYEKRWFASGAGISTDIDGIPFGTDIIVEHSGVLIGAEICEDLWTTIPPSCHQAIAGAEVLVNLSASDDVTGKYTYLRNLIKQQSARCIAAYAYASAGFGESSTDLVFDAKLMISENGTILADNKRWTRGNQIVVADVDIEAIRRDRIHNTSFNDSRSNEDRKFRTVVLKNTARPTSTTKLLRYINPRPFVPSQGEILNERCEEIIHIQVAGLAKRLEATHCKSLVAGISGGLDSTLALLIAVRTFDSLGLSRKGIIGVTMPGFGTTDRTYNNAITLMEALGVTIREISIVPAVNQHFADIGHDAAIHDVTYENSQARERTQLLMDIANQTGGMVLGTGDLSELALGWATYNGDHMSMYGVNAGVPKTLVKYLTRYFASSEISEKERTALLDIIDTPISPELIPAEADGSIKQKTEDLVGPYDLHDFFLYYTLRYGFTPKRIYILAVNAFAGEFDPDTILKWERVFFRRFFNQQFKRSCLPDGPKVGSVCLSPRGDWRMPSDASSALWLANL